MVEYFYAQGCSDCEKTDPIIGEIEREYGENITVEWIDTSTLNGWNKWNEYGFIEVPAIVVNNETKIPKEEITKEKLEGIIDAYLAGSTPEETFYEINWDIPLAYSLGFISVFTPCTAAALAFVFAYTIGSSKSSKDGIIKAFTFGFGLMVTLIIFGLLALLVGISFVGSKLYLQIVLGIISILIGLNLLGILKSPITMKPFMQKALGKYRQHTTLLGLFFLGILFQFIDMPCATPMFMVVLSKILLNADIQNFLLLFIFGFGVITPFVVLGIIGGFTPQLANKFRLKIRMNYGEKVRVVSSLILIGLGIWLIISSFS
jgi:cytochrome c biogenesis protein CcdA